MNDTTDNQNRPEVAKQAVTGAPPRLPRPVINEAPCKGCGLCIAACPKHVLQFKTTLNRHSIRPAIYVGEGCIGCNFCFYSCPEPFTIEVHKPDRP